jgi:hypothetical protein
MGPFSSLGSKKKKKTQKSLIILQSKLTTKILRIQAPVGDEKFNKKCARFGEDLSALFILGQKATVPAERDCSNFHFAAVPGSDDYEFINAFAFSSAVVPLSKWSAALTS